MVLIKSALRFIVKILLVEDQALVRGALYALLKMEDGIESVEQCENGVQALAYLKSHKVDIVLTDIEMPEMNGIELLERIRHLHPELKTVVVTTFGRAGFVRRAIDAGANAFLLKDAPSAELAETLFKVMEGRRVIDSELALMALGDKDPLTLKERKALQLVFDGFKTKQIACQLYLSEGTIRNYLSEAISKLHAANSVDAARIAKQKGWL